jgi:serine O-acetyltransferase
MMDLLRAYRRYDPAAKSILEIAILYPGPKAILLHSISHKLYGVGLFFLARLFCEIGRWMTGIEIHPGATIGRRLVLDHGMGIVIGETAEIGDDCLIFQGVTLGGTQFVPVKRHPTLCNRVVIGAGAKVLGPITLGDDVKVGSNAVVTKSFAAGSTLVGIPAVAVGAPSPSLGV